MKSLKVYVYLNKLDKGQRTKKIGDFWSKNHQKSRVKIIKIFLPFWEKT